MRTLDEVLEDMKMLKNDDNEEVSIEKVDEAFDLLWETMDIRGAQQLEDLDTAHKIGVGQGFIIGISLSIIVAGIGLMFKH